MKFLLGFVGGGLMLGSAFVHGFIAGTNAMTKVFEICIDGRERTLEKQKEDKNE